MKRLRRSRAARLTAQLLAVLLLVPYLLGGLTIRPAAAQAEAMDVIVMDFNNRSRIGGALVGRTAAAAFALELAQSARWQPVAERTVQQALNDLNLRPPFDVIALTRLAQRVDVRQVIVGEVASVRIAENPAQATVTLAVQMMDRASQEMINGAVVSGRSAPRIGYTGDPMLLVDEAISNAAFSARQQMERFELVEGTVMNTSVVGESYEALINIGARQGVKEGMRFIILRGDEMVGRARARGVDPDFSTLGITENFRGVKPEDRVRAVFQLPPLPRDVAEADGVRTVALQEPQQPNGEQPRPGDVVVPEVMPRAKERRPGMTRGARMLAGGLILLGLFGLAGRRGGTTAFRTRAQAITFGDQPAIRVTWERPREISAEDVIQYQIVRASAQQGECTVGVVQGDIREFIDAAGATAAVRNLGNLITGDPPVAAEACEDAELPIVPGRTYTYRVQTVFLPAVQVDGGNGGMGGTTDPTEAVSSPSPPSGPVTALALPTLVAPNDAATVDLTAANFQFMTVAGANIYAVQVSTDPSFQSGVTEVARVVNADLLAGETLATGPINLQSRFGGRAQLFWRVGARNEGDTTDPVGGFVFSLARSFVPAGP